MIYEGRLAYPSRTLGSPFDWGLFVYIVLNAVTAGYNIWYAIRQAKQQVGKPQTEEEAEAIANVISQTTGTPKSQIKKALMAPTGEEERAAVTEERGKMPTWAWVLIGLAGFMLLTGGLPFGAAERG